DGRGQRDRLLRLARMAEGLRGPEHDAKLRGAITHVRSLVDDGVHPILFCRFIPTAEYVAAELRKALPSTVEVAAVTGTLPPAEREERVRLLGEKPKRVLVATDCLSEGINLQEHFNAVVHYDLSWNPTRHEQREGRVDRFGQSSPTVRALTYYGSDNLVDGLVLRVLLRKHVAIRNSLGISVPVPATAQDVVQALMRGLMLQGPSYAHQLSLFGNAEDVSRDLHARWDQVADRERQSRTLFAQRTIDPSEVAREWQAMSEAVGTGTDVRRFLKDAVLMHGGAVREDGRTLFLNLKEAHGLRQAAGEVESVQACFELPAPDGATYLTRTHPLVEGMAGYVLNAALDPLTEGVARRCGAVRTRAVSERTTLLLVRLRYHIQAVSRGHPDAELLAEDCLTLAYTGDPAEPCWLPPDQVDALLSAVPARNTDAGIARHFVEEALKAVPALMPSLERLAQERGQELLEAHERVRGAGQLPGKRYSVRPQLPPDLLGVYVLLPAPPLP
ncbi:MAG: helicase-related protein, partial [Anaerolineae bacterium]